jgi:Tol biopolymer transport system component
VLASDGNCCSALLWASGGQLLFNPSGGLKTVPVQGGKPKRIAFLSCGTDRNSWGCATSGLTLSPNLKYAATLTTSDPSDPHSSYGIGLVKLDPGKQPVVLVSPLTAEESFGVIDSALAFSPDSTQLVFSRSSWDGWDAGPSSVRAISLAGGGSVPLAQSGIPGASLVPNDAAQVQWSPNGSWVAYTEADSAGTFQRLEVVPTDAGTPRVLATCNFSSLLGFSWSPTSNLIAYDCEGQSDREESVESSQFETVKPDGTDSSDLLSGRNLAYDQAFFGIGPRWSPDGSRLLFLAQRPLSDIAHVWTVRADGSHLTRRS